MNFSLTGLRLDILDGFNIFNLLQLLSIKELSHLSEIIHRFNYKKYIIT